MIFLGSNQTLYIAGGAVVQAGVYASGDNIMIRGRGMLDGLPWAVGYGPQPTGGNRGQILAENTTNLSIEGVILKDAWYTAVGLNRSDYVNVQNLKIVANRHDTVPPPGGLPIINEGMAPDGFHNFNTSHVRISDSFIRTDDDCIAPIVSWVPTPLTDGLTVTRTSLWTDRANIWRIGSGFQGLGVPSPSMRNMLFADIDVLHYDPRWNPVIRLMPNKDQVLENIRFENIRINHEGQAALVEIKPWANTRAPVRNVSFKDVSVTGNFNEVYGNVIVNGPDPTSSVTGVTFDNFIRHGQLTLASSPAVSVEGYTSNIVFIGGGTTTTTSLPDVIVTALSYANETFTATVKNLGSAATPAGVVIGVGWSVDGLYKTGAYVSNSLAAGASITINSRSYRIPVGTYTIMTYADDVNRFIESNETNNQLSKTIAVRTRRTPAPPVSRIRS
jgi:polygalacturonase